MTSLFIDSTALVALHYPKDSSRKKALEILEEISKETYTYFTSFNVLLETLTIVSQRVSKEYAVSLLDELRSGKYTVVHPDDQLVINAETLFRSRTSKNVSYSDCVSFAVMRRYGIQWVFSFDLHFKKQGFKRVGIDK